MLSSTTTTLLRHTSRRVRVQLQLPHSKLKTTSLSPQFTQSLKALAAKYSTSIPIDKKVLLSDATDPICAEVFRSRGHEVDAIPGMSKDELIKCIDQYDALVVRSATKVTKDVLEAAKNLKVVGRAGTGVDNIDIPGATMKGVLVVNTPGGNTISTAELSMSHILALSRNIQPAVASLKAGKWDRAKYTGTELSGKTLGVIGLGRIGREVAGWCQAFNMRIVGYDPILSAASAREAGIEPVTLEELYAESDFITMHTPFTKFTRNLINEKSISLMKDGVRIVNCARGGIIDEAALLQAIESGKVGGAAIDVYEQEPPTSEVTKALIAHPRVHTTPHLGANTVDAQVRVAKDIAVQISDIFEQKDFVGVINAPNMDFARKKQLLPFVQVAEKIGSLHSQLLHMDSKISKINIYCQGNEVSNPEMKDALKTAILKGALAHLLDQDVNYINAQYLGNELGIPVSVITNPDTKTGENDISVEFELDGIGLNVTRKITGTVLRGSTLQITAIDGFEVDLPPKGHLIVFNNQDRPGQLKQLSKILSASNCNIAHFTLGRQRKGDSALGAVTLDDEPPESVIEEIKKIQDFRNITSVTLLDTVDKVFRIQQDESTPSDGRPMEKPRNPQFSSGPTKKRPGYSYSNLDTITLGRSHRSDVGKAKLKLAITESKRLLGIPEDYELGFVPASDTGAYEMAMWNMLGARPVDVFHWESFGKGWFTDVKSHLKLTNYNEYNADYGQVPDFSKYNSDHDALFTFNGTTSGARVKDLEWVPSDRKGLTFNDATSAAFAMDIDWTKCDVTTYSFQKVLGGEGAHGVLILSPNAIERIETFEHGRPLPKIFRMVKKGKLDRAIFQGSTINTPSMLAIEDYLDALQWCDSTMGGVSGMIKKSQQNLAVLENFVANNEWIDFLVPNEEYRSSTSVCLTLDATKEQIKAMEKLLAKEDIAYDIGSYRDAPPGLRIWCGATVETEDLELLMPWLKWAYMQVKK